VLAICGPTAQIQPTTNLRCLLSPGAPLPEPTPMVFVVEDDPSVREALAGLIRSAGWNVEVYVSAQEFLAHPKPDGPGCLVLDIGLPGLSGLDLQSRMAELHWDIPIVFITGHGDIPMSVRAMKAGAVEFLTKPFVDQDLLDGIQLAIERDRIARSEEAQLRELRDCYASLTPREQQVLELVISGRLNKQAAAELGISEITIKVHRGRVMAKMRATSLPDLVNRAAKLKLRPAEKA
jgi:FixJ family two-component response regulator